AFTDSSEFSGENLVKKYPGNSGLVPSRAAPRTRRSTLVRGKRMPRPSAHILVTAKASRRGLVWIAHQLTSRQRSMDLTLGSEEVIAVFPHSREPSSFGA